MTFGEIAIALGCDKGPTPSGHHYTDAYEQLFVPPERFKRVLELGIFQGASLRMWRAKWPQAEVYGVDTCQEAPMPDFSDDPMMRTWCGDYLTDSMVQRLLDHGPYDLIVDDGSHAPAHQTMTLDRLYQALAPKGWYVIEDITQNDLHYFLRRWQEPALGPVEVVISKYPTHPYAAVIYQAP